MQVTFARSLSVQTLNVEEIAYELAGPAVANKKGGIERLWCEPVWPSGKALGWSTEGPRFDPLRLSFLFGNGGLWTPPCHSAPHN